MVALAAVSGCSEAANRTLTIFQLQSTETYPGAFRIDTSELPADAIEERSETGGPGAPESRITVNVDYEIEVVLRLADANWPNDKTVDNLDSAGKVD